jgi:hypothetical protein
VEDRYGQPLQRIDEKNLVICFSGGAPLRDLGVILLVQFHFILMPEDWYETLCSLLVRLQIEVRGERRKATTTMLVTSMLYAEKSLISAVLFERPF